MRLWFHPRTLAWALAMALALLATSTIARGWAQDKPSESEPSPSDASDKRSLSPADLARKNEHGYFTGLPLANFDPNSGVGFGVRAYRYENGARSDPRFRYTPYLHRVFAQAFATTGGVQFHWLDYDAPEFLGTPFRVRAQLIYFRNKAQHFYGLGESAIGDLTFTGAGRRFGSIPDYQEALDQVRSDGTTLSRYDEYDLERPLSIFGLERNFAGGRVRTLLGAAFNHSTIRDYTGKTVSARDADGNQLDATMGTTRLAEACASADIVGCDGGFEGYLRLAVSLDTRDFEPDPNSGFFADLAVDLAPGVFSRYRFARFLVSTRGYVSPIPKRADLVVAGRATFEWQSPGTPFFSLNTIPFTEDVRTGLGGIRTMRGFKQDRFVGRVFALVNAELRWTFTHFEVAKQKFALIAVPFLDIGRTFDNLRGLSLRGFRRGQGAAFRISWNLATIVTAEYGVSDEDSGLYINFAHQF